MSNNQTPTVPIVTIELVEDDKSILLNTPTLIQEVRRRPISVFDFFGFLKQGLTKGYTPPEWFAELVQTGQIASARKLLRLIPPEELTIAQRDLQIHSQNAKRDHLKQFEQIRDRLRRQRSLLKHQVIEDLQDMLEEARKLINEEWFSLASQNLSEVNRLLDVELAEAMGERQKRFNLAQEMIRPVLEKFIHSESILRLDGTINVFWELILHANRLSVDTEGNLELVNEACETIEQLYQGAPPNQTVLSQLRDLLGWPKEKPYEPNAVLARVPKELGGTAELSLSPLSIDERALLRKITNGQSSFLQIDLSKAKPPTNVAWNEDNASNLLSEANSIIYRSIISPALSGSDVVSSGFKVLEKLRYLLRYWGERKTIPLQDKVYGDLRRVLYGFAELKATGLLRSGSWDSSAEYYRTAFELRAQTQDFLFAEEHLYNYLSAYAIHTEISEENQTDISKEKPTTSDDEKDLIWRALCLNLKLSKDKTGVAITKGLVKLTAMHPWLLTKTKAALDELHSDITLGQRLSSGFVELGHLFALDELPTKLSQQLDLLVDSYSRHQHHTQSLLEELVEVTGSSRTVNRLGKIVDELLSPENLWDPTDLKLLESLSNLNVQLSRYFTVELPFQEREEIANTLWHMDIPHLIQLAEESPTIFGLLYLTRAAENIHSILEEEHASLHQSSMPLLDVQIEQSEWRSDDIYYCHFKLSNLGATHAESVMVHIDESPIHEYTIVDEKKGVGSIYSGLYRSFHIRIKPTPLEAKQNELALLVRLQYKNAGQNDLEERTFRLRVEGFAKKQPEFQIIQNPYIIGRPLINDRVFRGRDSLIDELWTEVANQERTGSVVIFGQKRSGKTSLLYALARHAPQFVIPVYFDIPSVLASLPRVQTTLPFEQRHNAREEALGRFLLALAENTVAECQKREIQVVPITWEQIMAKPGPDIQFRKFLDQFRSRLDGYRLLFLMDEFTSLITKIDEDVVDEAIMRLFKSLIENGFFSCIICGLIEVYGAVKRFANQLAVSKPIPVDYLSFNAAQELIEDPIRVSDGGSRFNSVEIVREIYDLTAGSPFYIQIFCHRLVRYMNMMKIARITAADIDEVTRSLIEGTERIDPVQFDNLYSYKNEPDDERSAVLEGLVVHLLAHETVSKPYASLQAIYKPIKHFVSADQLDKTLAELVQRGTIVQQVDAHTTKKQNLQSLFSHHYCIKIDLFRRWLLANRPLDDEALRNFERKLSNESLLSESVPS